MDGSKTISLHNKKITQIKKDLEAKEYNCIRNFPIKIENKPRKKIDLFCYKINKILGIEVDSDVKNLQAEENGKKLDELKRIFGASKDIQLCHYDLLKGGCEK